MAAKRNEMLTKCGEINQWRISEIMAKCEIEWQWHRTMAGNEYGVSAAINIG